MKKTWIKIKRGLLEPKHIEALGQAWYLYLYILDQADWDSGTIPEWKDKYAADELGKPLGMIREHRKQLEENNYIKTVKNQYSQTIIIRNWTNPRAYDGVVINLDSEKTEPRGCEKSIPKDEKIDQSTGQSTPQSTGQSFKDQAKLKTLPYSHISQVTDHSKDTDDESSETIYEDCDDYGEPIKGKKKQKQKPEIKKLYPIAAALSEVTGMSFDSNKEKIFREAKYIVRDPRVTAEEIKRQFSPGGDWYRCDWRGQKGQRPILTQVRETIFTFKEPGNRPEPKGMAAVRAMAQRLEAQENGDG